MQRLFWAVFRLFCSAALFAAGYAAAVWASGSGERPVIWVGTPDALRAEMRSVIGSVFDDRLAEWTALLQYAEDASTALEKAAQTPQSLSGAIAPPDRSGARTSADRAPSAEAMGPAKGLDDIVATLSATMTDKEKRDLLYWAQSRLTVDDVERLAAIFSRGWSAETIGEAYGAVEDKLSGDDLAYLFSLLERYAKAKQMDGIPVFKPLQQAAP
ncbi:MAG: hypothetical protein IMW86_01390 [Hydrogenibacillus sp.]|nr:hypothetical protein [Hydrogenibacillus sp.]